MNLRPNPPPSNCENNSIVGQVAANLLAINSEDEALLLVAEVFIEKLDIDQVTIYLLDEKRRILKRRTSCINESKITLSEKEPKEITPGTGLVGHAAEQQILITVNDCHISETCTSAKFQSEVAIPMTKEGKLIGVVSAKHVKANSFPVDVTEILTSLASVLAVKLETIRNLYQLQSTIEKLEYSGKIQDALFEIAELIFETETMSEFYSRLHHCIGTLTFASNFFVGLVVDDGNAITLPYAVDEVDIVPPDEVIPLDLTKPSITGYVLNTDKPLLATKKEIQHMIDTNQVYIKGSLPYAWLGVPFGEAPLKGVVVVQSYSPDKTFTNKDKQLLCFVARHVRNAIERMQARSDLQFLALHDPLTKLPNRSLFNDRVNQALHKSKRQHDNGIALLFLDLDKFKQVNDTYGHHIGDLLLIEVANTISACVRASDTLSRLGGDEFAILLEDIKSPQCAQKVAEKVIHALQKSFILEKISINTTTSIGIVFDKEANKSVESLVIHADEAMYRAKQRGRNQAVFYENNEQISVLPKNNIERDALEGLKADKFFFLFQPIVDLQSSKIIAAEALIRWNCGRLGTLPPESFLNELVENESILQLDIYVFKLAVEHLNKWHSSLPEGFRLSINISGQGFSSTEFLEVVQQSFEQTPHLFEYLCFETTEKCFVRNVELTRAQMNVFSRMGIHIALDDYGTGYSSLSYLGQFKFNYLKIDKSFISGHEASPEHSIILESITSLARSLAIKTVAEGIETPNQYSVSQTIHCTFGQGNYLSHPVTEELMYQFIKEQPVLPV